MVIIPDAFTNEAPTKMTQAIYQMQISLETYFETIASLQNKKVLLVTDRGVCDNFVYCSPENKHSLVATENWSMNYLCNERYDMVLHLVMAANGAGEFNNLVNYSARLETKELVVTMHNKGQNGWMDGWMSHPNFVIVDNSKTWIRTKNTKNVILSGQFNWNQKTTQFFQKILAGI